MLSCGCTPSLEGGYGVDGTQGRYSIEWCAMHKAAPAMRGLLEEYWDTSYLLESAKARQDFQARARALLASLEPKEKTA